MQHRARLYNNDKATSERFSSGSRFVVFLIFVGIASVVWLFLGIKSTEVKPIVFRLSVDKNIRNAQITISDTLIIIKKRESSSDVEWNQLKSQNNTRIIIVGNEMPKMDGEISVKKLIRNRFSLDETYDFSVFPEQLHYQKVSLNEKVMSLNTKNAILPKDGWEVLGEPKFEFDKIVVRGKKQVLNRLSMLELDAQRLKTEYGEQELALLIHKPAGVFLDKRWVNVRFKAEPFVVKKITVPIDVDSFNRELRLLPSQIEVELKIPLSIVKEISADNFLVGVDVTQIGHGQYLDVIVSELPENIKLIQTYPSKVEYIQIQK